LNGIEPKAGWGASGFRLKKVTTGKICLTKNTSMRTRKTGGLRRQKEGPHRSRDGSEKGSPDKEKDSKAWGKKEHSFGD